MWSQLSLVTDTELGQLEPEAVASGSPWGAVTWTAQRTEAKRDLKIWLERDFAKAAQSAGVAIPGITDRILDRWAPDWAFGYTNSTYSDLTSKVRDDTEEDVDLAGILATVGTDRIYIGALWEFEGLFVKLLDSLNAVASVLTVKYWGPKGWTSISATDGTIGVTGKTFSQSGRITWTLPTDWERVRLNGTGDEYYWVEISISVALTAGTAASQILPIRGPDGLKRVAGFLALAHIFRGLAAAAAVPEAWLSRVSNEQRTGYYDQAVDLYTNLRDGGGIPIDLSRNDAIETGEQQVTQALRLRRG